MEMEIKELLVAFVHEVHEVGYAHKQAKSIARYCDHHQPCEELLQEISAFLKKELTPVYIQEGWGTGISVKQHIENDMSEIKHDMKLLKEKGITIF